MTQRELRALRARLSGGLPEPSRSEPSRSSSAPPRRPKPSVDARAPKAKKQPPPFSLATVRSVSRHDFLVESVSKGALAGSAMQKPTDFHARPAPARSGSSPPWTEQLQERELERKQRLRKQAEDMARRARLPPRMQSRAQTEQQRRQAELERIKAEAEPPAAAPFKARPIPAAVFEPKWERMQEAEMSRHERIALNAQRLRGKSRLPPRMERHAEEEATQQRRQRELDRIRSEARQGFTFRPSTTKVIPDFNKPFRPKPRGEGCTVQPKPFTLLTNQLKDPDGTGHMPTQRERKRVLLDMRRDELVLNERRWPELSTRAPVTRKQPPDFSQQHRSVPKSGTTVSNELRKESAELHKMQKELVEERQRKEEEARRAAAAAARRRVAAELGVPSAAAKALYEAEKRREQKETERQRQRDFEQMLASMNERVAARPFLFQQVYTDDALLREKQRLYDTYDATLRKSGLADLLDMPLPKATP